MEKKRTRRARPVGEVITSSLPPAFRIAMRLAEMEQQWRNIAGPQLAGRTQPLRLENKVLVVACETPAAAQYVNMSGATLLMRIKRLIGLDLPGVRAIVRTPEKPRRRPDPKGHRVCASPQAVEESLARAAEKVKDPGIALAFARAEAAAQARWGEGRKRKARDETPS